MTDVKKKLAAVGAACTCAAAGLVFIYDLFPMLIAASRASVGSIIVCLALGGVFIGYAVFYAVFCMVAKKQRLFAFGRLALRAAALCFVLLAAEHIHLDTYVRAAAYCVAAIWCMVTSFGRNNDYRKDSVNDNGTL